MAKEPAVFCTLGKEGTFSFDSEADLKLLPDDYKKITSKVAIDHVLYVVGKQQQRSRPLMMFDGKTGCGKSTFLISSLFKTFKKNVIVIEPRVVLTSSNASVLNKHNEDLKMGLNLGYENGKDRFIPKSSPSITYVTTQIFVNNIEHYENSIICVDEVHTTDLPMLSLLKDLKTNLEQIITKGNIILFLSATMNFKLLAKYMEIDLKDPLSFVHIKGNTNFPIDVRHVDLVQERIGNLYDVGKFIGRYMDKEIEERKNQSESIDLLYIVPTKKSIEFTIKGIKDHWRKIHNIFNLNLIDFNDFIQQGTPASKVEEIIEKAESIPNSVAIIPYVSEYATTICADFLLRPIKCIKIIIASPVIEVGQNIFTLKTVIDSGLIFDNYYDPLSVGKKLVYNGANVLISKDTQTQRIGRVGRHRPGVALLMYSKEVDEMMEEVNTPENRKIGSLGFKIKDLPMYEPINIFNDFDYLYENSMQIYIKTIKDLRACGLLNPSLSVNQYLMKSLNLLTFEELQEFITIFDNGFIKLYKMGYTLVESLILHKRYIEQNKKTLSQHVSLELLNLPKHGQLTSFNQTEVETVFEKLDKINNLLEKIFYESQKI